MLGSWLLTKPTITDLNMVLLAVLFLTAPVLAMADDAADPKKKIFMDQKKLVVIENMEFIEIGAVNFRPIYENYQEKLFISNQ